MTTLDHVGGRTLDGLLDTAAAGRPDTVFLRTTDGAAVTYAEFLRLRDRAATGLRRRGIGRGDTVALHLRTSVEMLAVLCAVHRLGAVAAMSDPTHTDRELSGVVERCGAALTVTDEPNALPHVRLAELGTAPADPGPPAGTDPDAPATVLFTSGTTARPKAVVYTHGHHVHGADVYARVLHLDPGSRLMHHFPLFHMNGLNQLGAALLVGSEVLLVERFRSGRFDALLDAFAPTATFLNSTHIKMVREAGTRPTRPSPLRRVGMALQMADADYDWFEERYGRVLVEGYGQTETITLCLANPVLGARRGSCGLPVPGYRVRVGGGGPTGELQVRCDSRFGTMQEYLGDPAATAAAFDDGWLRTGDVVRVDEDGFVFHLDRAKDIIKRAGENISAREVEAVLERHPGVVEAAVVGRRDALREEVPVAFVVVDDGVDGGVDLDELRRFCLTELARHKVPEEFLLSDPLPRTAVGKIEKKALRARIEAR